MLYEFLINNRTELEVRCRVKVGERVGRSATEQQLDSGIPMFLDQLIRTLQIEQTATPLRSRSVSGPAGGGAVSEMSVSAAQHGKDLLALGLTVDQVVHDYGDLCQSITDLAVERDAPFQVDEFRTLNRCLDNAIADAVTEFTYQRDFLFNDRQAAEHNERMGFFAHELRNLLGTAMLAFSAVETGNLNMTGATGSMLGRSLKSMENLIATTLDEARDGPHASIALTAWSLAAFVKEIEDVANLSARVHLCTLQVAVVDGDLAIRGDRALLLAAVANLLQNAFKFSPNHTEVALTAYAAGERVLIEVRDHCGGLGDGVAETMFLPFMQSGKDRSGIGLGLTIARQSVMAQGGMLTVRNLAGVGCVFTIDLPRYALPT